MFVFLCLFEPQILTFAIVATGPGATGVGRVCNVWMVLKKGWGPVHARVRISDRTYEKDSRRYDLAYRLLRHAARTQTIKRWTGLSGYRIRTLIAEYPPSVFGADVRRHRGVPPHRLDIFSRNCAYRRETMTLAALFQAADLISIGAPPIPAHAFPNLVRGELLCTAYETFRALVPESRLTIDHAALLAISLGQRQEIQIGRCAECDGLTVLDVLAARTRPCVYCEEEKDDGGEDEEPPTAMRNPPSTSSAPCTALRRFWTRSSSPPGRTCRSKGSARHV